MPLPALAHARLTSSAPSAGALLDLSPSKIEMHFSESVSLQFTTLKLLDRSRKELAIGAPHELGNDPQAITADLPPNLPQGTYTIVWRTLSASDGHVTAGTFPFKVKGQSGGPAGAATPETTPGAGATSQPEEDTQTSPTSPVEGSSESPDPFRWLVRAVLLATAALLAGGAIFAGLVVRPTAEQDPEAKARMSPALGRASTRAGVPVAALLVLALLLDVVLQVGSIAGGGLGGGITHLDLLGTLITTTGYGYAWIVKVIAALVLLFVMLGALRIRTGTGGGGTRAAAWSFAAVAGLALAFGEALSSHAAASAGGTSGDGGVRLSGGLLPLPILSDWLHLATAFTWVGGIGYMTFILFPTFCAVGIVGAERRAFLSKAVPRFSRLAVASVIVLALTGTYNLIQHTTDLSAVLGSQYGQVLAIKVALFVFLVALGAVNLRRLTPGFSRVAKAGSDEGKSDPAQRLRRNVRREAMLAEGALICAAGLSLLPPPASAGSGYSAGNVSSPSPTVLAGSTPTDLVAEATAATSGPLIAVSASESAGYRVVLTATSSFEGDELVASISRVDPAAAPLTDVQKVIFRVTPQDVDGGSSSLTATRDTGETGGNQTWRAKETLFTLDGRYQVSVILQRTVAQDLKVGFRVDLAEGTGLKARPSQVLDVLLDTSPSPPISGTATLLLKVVDGTGAPVSDAKISVNPLMPAHGHIEPTDIARPVPGRPGNYTMPVHFTMGGSWLIIFNVERPGMDTLKVDAGLDVIDPNATPTPA